VGPGGTVWFWSATIALLVFVVAAIGFKNSTYRKRA
jgi:hypothetical protein